MKHEFFIKIWRVKNNKKQQKNPKSPTNLPRLYTHKEQTRKTWR